MGLLSLLLLSTKASHSNHPTPVWGFSASFVSLQKLNTFTSSYPCLGFSASRSLYKGFTFTSSYPCVRLLSLWVFLQRLHIQIILPMFGLLSLLVFLQRLHIPIFLPLCGAPQPLGLSTKASHSNHPTHVCVPKWVLLAHLAQRATREPNILQHTNWVSEKNMRHPPQKFGT